MKINYVIDMNDKELYKSEKYVNCVIYSIEDEIWFERYGGLEDEVGNKKVMLNTLSDYPESVITSFAQNVIVERIHTWKEFSQYFWYYK